MVIFYHIRGVSSSFLAIRTKSCDKKQSTTSRIVLWNAIFIRVYPVFLNFSVTVFRSRNYVILVFDIKFVKISAPAPHADNEIRVFFGVCLRVK